MNKNIIIVLGVIIIAVLGYYFYQESQKSDLEKAAEEVAEEMEDLADRLD